MMGRAYVVRLSIISCKKKIYVLRDSSSTPWLLRKKLLLQPLLLMLLPCKLTFPPSSFFPLFFLSPCLFLSFLFTIRFRISSHHCFIWLNMSYCFLDDYVHRFSLLYKYMLEVIPSNLKLVGSLFTFVFAFAWI